VVIPTRGRPNVVARAAKSALAQTLAEIEVIVVLDGPDPETRRSLADLGDDRLRLVELPERRGAAAARNVGIAAARAPWLALLDDDDLWAPEKLARQLASNPAANEIVACRLEYRSPTERFVAPRRLPEPGELLSEYLFCRRGWFRLEGVLQSSMLLAATQLWLRIPFQEGLRRHQEMDWLLRAVAEAGARVRWVDGVLGTWDVTAAGGRVSASTDWRYSLEWIRGSRARVTPRAFSAFVLTRVGARAADGRDWSAFPYLLREALRAGGVRPKELLLYLGLWFLPAGLRQGLRRLFALRKAPVAQAD
jgi:glycosyltransferase involved in cell wall biosynthesis